MDLLKKVWRFLKAGWDGLLEAYSKDWFSLMGPVLILLLAWGGNIPFWVALNLALIALFHGMGMFFIGKIAVWKDIRDRTLNPWLYDDE